MKRQSTSERAALFSYFLILIGVGTLLLDLPASWNGENRLHLLDAFFTAVSSVCVTGLITVDTAEYSLFGKWVILMLIQFGGLGILTFTTMFFIANRSRKVSFSSLKVLRNYYLESIEYQAHHILRNIMVMTGIVEISGACILWARMKAVNPETSFFTALFHSVSAFCNAGFSLYPDNLARFTHDPFILVTIMVLIISGGLGFLVFNDLLLVARHKKRTLSLHARMVLIASGILIVLGIVVYSLLEWKNGFSGMKFSDKILNALFQAVTPRTAGFNTVSQESLSIPSRVFTMLLMFIGGSPASIAGGIKTTTFAIVFISILKEIDWQGRIRIGNRVLSRKTVTRSIFFLGKAMALLGLSVFFLTITEMTKNGSSVTFLQVIFECFSAFGTVGLSLGLTGILSSAGKIVIIMTMFAGRVGLISLAMPLIKENKKDVEYPEEEVLIG